MRFGLLVITLCVLIGLSGCVLSSNPSLNWSKNIALDATSEDSRFHDDNMHTPRRDGDLFSKMRKDEASQMESDKFTEAVLKWRQPQTIQQVVVKSRGRPDGILRSSVYE